MKINNDILCSIKKYSFDNSSHEVCGFVVQKNDLILFLPIENKHPQSKNNFLISPKDYLRIKKDFEILYFFHSHIDNPFFSELDILYQKYHNINMLMYNISTDEIKEMRCK